MALRRSASQVNSSPTTTRASRVIGRVIEVLRGEPFDAVLRKYLARPLGLGQLATSAERRSFRARFGHIKPTQDAEPSTDEGVVAGALQCPSRLVTDDVSGLSSFALHAWHIDHGLAEDGIFILAEDAVQAMQDRQVDVPYLGRSRTHVAWVGRFMT